MLVKNFIFKNFFEGIIYLVFWGQDVDLGSKMAKKVVFKAVTLLPTQFSIKAKFLTAIVS